MLVIASNQNGTAATASNQTQIVAPLPPANTAAPTVTGVAQRTYTLSATAGSWTGAGNSISYQWQRDAGEGFEDIPGATGTSYLLTQIDEGTTVRIVVTATNPDATISEASQSTATILSALPVNAAAPTISGSALRGSTLTGSLGTWTGFGNAYAWQWQRSSDGTSWTDIAGANTYSYTLSVADVGDYVRVMVKVANGDGAATAASPPTAIVQATPPSGITLPTISGIAQRSYTLTSAAGTWDGIGNTYSYQWQRDRGQGFLSISGANASTYPLDATDEGTAVRLLITASNPDAAVSVASPASAVVKAAGAVNTSGPQSPAPRSAATRSAATGHLERNRQRLRDPVAGVHRRGGMVRHHRSDRFLLRAGGRRRGHETALLGECRQPRRYRDRGLPADGARAGERAGQRAAPTITGTSQRGGTLSSTSGAWSGLGNTFSFQWQRSSTAGAWTDISGANAATYTVAVADEGANLRLAITVSNLDGSLTVASQSTAIAPSDPPVNRSPPTSPAPPSARSR